MTAQDTFDRRLGEALLAYAAEAAIEPDPMRFAASIAAARPRGRLAGLVAALRRSQLRLIWLAILLLGLAAAAGAALVGMHWTDRPSQLVDGPVPDELFGRWVSDGSADQYLDLNATPLLHGSEGSGLDSLGSVAAFQPASPGSIEGRVLIRAGFQCGDATYGLLLGDAPSAGATPAPLPPSVQPPPQTIVQAFRLVEATDPCGARRTLLADHLWRRLQRSLAPGATLDSLDFAEPFHLALPADVAQGLPNGDHAGVMYETRPNQLRMSHAWWNAAFLDDIPVNRVPCRADLGTLPDIPASVDEVGAWLATATEVRFNGPTELVVDGRRALRWEMTGECRTGTSAISDLAAGSEYYAIPTADDVILFVVRADTPNESKVAERIMLALRFD